VNLVEVKVKIVGQRTTHKVKITPRTKTTDLLKLLCQNLETVVVRVNGKIITEEERLAGGDLGEILPIVTGG